MDNRRQFDAAAAGAELVELELDDDESPDELDFSEEPDFSDELDELDDSEDFAEPLLELFADSRLSVR